MSVSTSSWLVLILGLLLCNSSPIVAAPTSASANDALAQSQKVANDDDDLFGEDEEATPKNKDEPAKDAPAKDANDDAPADDAPDDEPQGQADLDKATSLKITSENLDDLGRVIQLCESAMQKGLDKENRNFARQLLASTRLERATRVSAEIFDRTPPNQNWPRLARIAVVDLELALQQNEKIPEAHFLLGRIQSLPGGNRKRALKSLDKAVEFAGDNLRLRAESLSIRADLQEDGEKKLADYDAALKLSPDNVRALRGRGLLHMSKNRHKKALADFRRAIELEPDNAKTHEAAAIELFMTKKFDEAKASLDAAIKLAPDEATAYAHRARINAVQGKLDEALADVNKALDMAASNLGWRLLRAQIHQQADRTDEALLDVERVLTVKPDLVEAMRLRAAILASADRMDEAIEGLKRAVAAAPKDIDLMMSLAMFYQANDKPRKAAKTYTTILTLDEKNLSALRGRADARLSLGQQANAIADYEAALKVEPQDSGILNNLAWVLCTSPKDELRDGKRAIKLAELAAKLTDYEQPHILSTLAAAHAESGDFETAIKWSQKAHTMGDGEMKAHLEKELESFKAGKPWREDQGAEEDSAEEESPVRESPEKKDDEPREDTT